MGNELRIIYIPQSHVTPNVELNALNKAYCFIIDCHAKKKGGPATAPDDAKKESTHVRAKPIIPE
jgi:hypothetical protein